MEETYLNVRIPSNEIWDFFQLKKMSMENYPELVAQNGEIKIVMYSVDSPTNSAYDKIPILRVEESGEEIDSEVSFSRYGLIANYEDLLEHYIFDDVEAEEYIPENDVAVSFMEFMENVMTPYAWNDILNGECGEISSLLRQVIETIGMYGDLSDDAMEIAYEIGARV